MPAIVLDDENADDKASCENLQDRLRPPGEIGNRIENDRDQGIGNERIRDLPKA